MTPHPADRRGGGRTANLCEQQIGYLNVRELLAECQAAQHRVELALTQAAPFGRVSDVPNVLEVVRWDAGALEDRYGSCPRQETLGVSWSVRPPDHEDLSLLARELVHLEQCDGRESTAILATTPPPVKRIMWSPVSITSCTVSCDEKITLRGNISPRSFAPTYNVMRNAISVGAYSIQAVSLSNFARASARS